MAQAIFNEVIAGDVEAVKALVDAKPAVLEMRATGSPAKYRGLSPLQVAICAMQYEMAEWLIHAGADVNYTDPKPRDEWSVPVLHDAVKSAVYRARRELPRLSAEDAKIRSDAAFGVLSLMLERGARVDVLDSLGNTTIAKAAMAVSEFYPWVRDPDEVPPTTMPEVTVADYDRIFAKLYEFGADPDVVDPHLGHVVSEFYRDHPVGPFLVSG